MGLIKKFLEWRKGRQEQEPEREQEEWDEVVYDRQDLNIHDGEERRNYILNCLEQIAEAAREVDALQFEYNMVTSYLKDMEEIESLPPEEKEELTEAASKIDQAEGQRAEYLERSGRMTDGEYKKMESLGDEAQEGYRKLKEAEDYHGLIKQDLKRLDGEKHAYLFRRQELKNMIEDTRNMTVVCIVALVFCLILLLSLQVFLELDIKTGYFITVGAAALGITLVFFKHNDAVRENKRVDNGINRIIQLQNRVKIRYVNNTNLLDYLYMKYNVSSAAQLDKQWTKYLEEKEARIKYRDAERELDTKQQELLKVLRKFQVKDPAIWLHQTAALLDKKEMVEIRHNLIIRRQSLRRRMDYNKEVVAHSAQEEIKDLVARYPKYAGEILAMVDQYEKKFQ